MRIARFGKTLALALLPGLAVAEVQWETSGFVKNETAVFTRDGTVIGSNNAHQAGQAVKFENSAALFINADFSERLAAHAQLNLISDAQGVSRKYRGPLDYSQHDYLRELYVDYASDDISLRLGKQQEVWGTADGIKLLDILNPTDFREFSQNTQEDSRIPVWMAKLGQRLDEHHSLEFVLAQAQANRIPGLNAEGDAGQPFITLGVDSITGQANGFLHLTPALGQTALAFSKLAAGFSQGQSARLEDFGGAGFTVQDFVNGLSPFCDGSNDCAGRLNEVAQPPGLGGNQNRTNLVEAHYDAAHPDNAFEYLPRASFATFDSFVDARSRYQHDYPGQAGNLGLRFQGLARGTINYSLNYLYHYDANPSVALSWEDRAGQPLRTEVTRANGVETVRLRRADGSLFQPPDALNQHDGPAVLVFREQLHRVHSLGAAFDTIFDSEALGEPLVLRGELLYQRGAYLPVINRDALAIGDLAGGLHSEPADMFKYVLGAELTVLTNLMISGQFIQYVNLDYVDAPGANGVNSGRYTADPATLHLTNNLRKGRRIKNFASLFLSKPFGEAQRGRVENLTLFEQGGGYWNRLGFSYAFSDRLIASLEWNHYGGRRDTTFGQMADSSNLQMGLKYLLE